MTEKKVVFWDFDGTLADSLSNLKKIYFTFLAEFSIQGTELEFQELNGPTWKEVVSILKTRHRLNIDLNSLHNKYYHHLVNAYHTTNPNRGIPEILELAKTHGWQNLVVTSNSEAIVSDVLKKWQLTYYFEKVIGLESFHKGKPSPEPYLKAIEASACEVKQSFAVEDSLNGLKSATSAGLKTFWLSGEDASLLSLQNLDVKIIKNIQELAPWISGARV